MNNNPPHSVIRTPYLAIIASNVVLFLHKKASCEYCQFCVLMKKPTTDLLCVWPRWRDPPSDVACSPSSQTSASSCRCRAPRRAGASTSPAPPGPGYCAPAARPAPASSCPPSRWYSAASVEINKVNAVQELQIKFVCALTASVWKTDETRSTQSRNYSGNLSSAYPQSDCDYTLQQKTKENMCARDKETKWLSIAHDRMLQFSVYLCFLLTI